jgi:hypothetical protein
VGPGQDGAGGPRPGAARAGRCAGPGAGRAVPGPSTPPHPTGMPPLVPSVNGPPMPSSRTDLADLDAAAAQHPAHFRSSHIRLSGTSLQARARSRVKAEARRSMPETCLSTKHARIARLVRTCPARGGLVADTSAYPAGTTPRPLAMTFCNRCRCHPARRTVAMLGDPVIAVVAKPRQNGSICTMLRRCVQVSIAVGEPLTLRAGRALGRACDLWPSRFLSGSPRQRRNGQVRFLCSP